MSVLRTLSLILAVGAYGLALHVLISADFTAFIVCTMLAIISAFLRLAAKSLEVSP